MNFVPFLNAGAPQGAGQGSLLMTFLPFLLIIVIFYFFMIRPQNKKQKETQKMLNALKKGDKVVTIGGIHGVVSSVKDNTIIVKVDENAKIEFTRSAISGVEKSDEELAKEAKALEEAKAAKAAAKAEKEAAKAAKKAAKSEK
ncbi:MAG: preprotein translocase subunit YajC [Treponema sp.]|nr:preprotein translocase subunit YajC [Treponema sp.]